MTHSPFGSFSTSSVKVEKKMSKNSKLCADCKFDFNDSNQRNLIKLLIFHFSHLPLYDNRGLVRHMTIWHSISSGKINLLHTGHLNPAKAKKTLSKQRREHGASLLDKIHLIIPHIIHIHTPSTFEARAFN